MPRVGLTRDAVVALAVELLEEDPVAPLTLARVAARAGVAVPSLYKHVSSLDALRDGVAVVGVTRIADAVEAAAGSGDGFAAFAGAAHAIRREALAHPALYLASQPAPGRDASPELLGAAGRTVSLLAGVVRQAGVPAEREIDAVRIVRAAIHGFVVLDTSGGFGLPDDVDASFERLLEVVWAGLASLT
ncbi:MAG: TetR/AcrR family transcriptional regulator [Microbacteriaceae bacterium]|nr:MAG: TetR/AcrR family transcriptional regulator [Microbacteriaceae bacterium]